MSFLRALSGELPAQTAVPGSISPHQQQIPQQQQQQQQQQSTHHRQRQDQTHNPSSTASTQKRHHAKALLHPMALLLRRRSGQSNTTTNDSQNSQSYQLVASKYGPTRELPDDFDPGIIYGTRHPDWSFPRRSANKSINQTFTGTEGAMPEALISSPDEETNKEPVSHRNRQALFTEHFGDIDSTKPPTNGSMRTTEDHNIDHHHDHKSDSVNSTDSHNIESSTRNLGYFGGSDGALNGELQSESADRTSTRRTGADRPEDRGIESRYHASSSDLSQVLLNNSSRFSFEASSTAESLPHEELSLSDRVWGEKSQSQPQYENINRRASESGSFASDDDDVPSIISEDLIGDDDDGFVTSNFYSDYPTAIEPPPGFEHVVIPSSSSRKPGDIQPFSEQSLKRESNSRGASIASSECGTNGSTTDDEQERVHETTVSQKFPPFVNPPGSALHSNSSVLPLSKSLIDDDYTTLDTLAPSTLTFHNTFQTGAQGVSEYDAGSPSSFAAVHSPVNLEDGIEEFDYDHDEQDEDEMIAEANRDVLASDSDGWYGQEFGFYPTSSTNSTYTAGGFFGIELPKPGFIRNPSLTPISERSESSLRNSLSMINPVSLSAGGVSAGPLSAALFAELANSGQVGCDEATLTQLQLLGTSKTWDDPSNSPLTFTSNSPIIPTGASAKNQSLFSVRQSTPNIDPANGRPPPADQGTNQVAEISTSYIYDADLGWVMEKRKGDEVLRRELVHGAV